MRWIQRNASGSVIFDGQEILNAPPAVINAVRANKIAMALAAELEKVTEIKPEISDNITRAIEDYTAAIAINPVYALAYNNRGYAYESLGRRGDAIADFNAGDEDE